MVTETTVLFGTFPKFFSHFGIIYFRHEEEVPVERRLWEVAPRRLVSAVVPL
jgi:hypothetical protein